MNPYAILGVAPTATAAEIKGAYRKLAKQRHPDMGGDPKAFEELSRAMTVLKDPARREKFDRTGTMDDAVDNAESEAFNIVTEVLEYVLDSNRDDLEYDVFACLKADLSTLIKKHEGERDKWKRLAAKMRKVAERAHVKPKKAAPPLLKTVLEGRARQHEETVAKSEAMIRKLKRAHEIVNAFDFEFTPQYGAHGVGDQMRAMRFGRLGT